MSQRQIIGITGTIASGKSLIGTMLTQRGFPVIDTDEVVHQLFACDAVVKAKILAAFGDTVLAADGSIDRSALAKIVFYNQPARRQLEAIVHPATIEKTQSRINALSNQPIVFILVPLLFEAGLEERYDQIWTVFARDSVVRERLRQRNNLSDQEIDARLAAQFSQATKRERSHKTIDNSGTKEETEKQLNELLAELNAKYI